MTPFHCVSAISSAMSSASSRSSPLTLLRTRKLFVSDATRKFKCNSSFFTGGSSNGPSGESFPLSLDSFVSLSCSSSSALGSSRMECLMESVTVFLELFLSSWSQQLFSASAGSISTFNRPGWWTQICLRALWMQINSKTATKMDIKMN